MPVVWVVLKNKALCDGAEGNMYCVITGDNLTPLQALIGRRLRCFCSWHACVLGRVCHPRASAPQLG